MTMVEVNPNARLTDMILQSSIASYASQGDVIISQRSKELSVSAR